MWAIVGVCSFLAVVLIIQLLIRLRHRCRTVQNESATSHKTRARTAQSPHAVGHPVQLRAVQLETLEHNEAAKMQLWWAHLEAEMAFEADNKRLAAEVVALRRENRGNKVVALAPPSELLGAEHEADAADQDWAAAEEAYAEAARRHTLMLALSPSGSPSSYSPGAGLHVSSPDTPNLIGRGASTGASTEPFTTPCTTPVHLQGNARWTKVTRIHV